MLINGKPRYVIKEKELRKLYSVLTDVGVPMNVKRASVVEYEEHLLQRDRDVRLHFLTELIWMLCRNDMKEIEKAFEERQIAEDMEMDVSSLIKAGAFLMETISDEEVGAMMKKLEYYMKRYHDGELPFM